MSIKASILVACVSALLLSSCTVVDVPKDEGYAFGAIADCQYCKEPGRGVRKYAMSVKKLQDCVDDLNTMDLEFTVHLGDFIDRKFESFGDVIPIYKQLKKPGYHVLGNHDFSVADDLKESVPATMGLPSRYYEYAVNGWRYVVLDGNDLSFHGWPAGSETHKQAAEYYAGLTKKLPKYNGALGPDQMVWVEKVLQQAQEKQERVILFCHFPVYPKNGHNLWNDTEVIALLEKYSCVKAYINGHNHRGGYGVKNGIHYLTLKGMVDTEETSYAVINVADDRINVKGYGREEDRVLMTPPSK